MSNVVSFEEFKNRKKPSLLEAAKNHTVEFVEGDSILDILEKFKMVNEKIDEILSPFNTHHYSLVSHARHQMYPDNAFNSNILSLSRPVRSQLTPDNPPKK